MTYRGLLTIALLAAPTAALAQGVPASPAQAQVRGARPEATLGVPVISTRLRYNDPEWPAGVPSPLPRVPMTLPVPFIHTWNVVCHAINEDHYTLDVHVSPSFLPSGSGGYPDRIRFEFRNLDTGRVISSVNDWNGSANPSWDGASLTRYRFALPAGAYDVSVVQGRSTGPAQPPTFPDPVANGVIVERNVVIPQTVGTGGRGTGCRFT